MKKPPKHYDAQFKRDAVELLLTSGKPSTAWRPNYTLLQSEKEVSM